MSRCGGCILCCDLLEVRPLGKQANARCEHCTPDDGCSIWERRPAICKKYACLWYANPSFPDSLRPDRCGVLFEPVRGERVVIANVDPQRSKTWRTRNGVANSLINRYISEGIAVVVIVGYERHFILPDGVSSDEVWAAVLRAIDKLRLVA